MLSSREDKGKHTRLSRVEISLLILLAFGLPMIVLIPPGAGYDEEDHLVRVWELAKLSLVPGELAPQELRYPIVYRDFAYRQQGSTGVIDSDYWQRYGRASLDERGFVRREIDTKSVYSPALLLPQAVVMQIAGRLVELPALAVFYLCRLAGLLSYLILVWLAIRRLPFGKWILLVLAASPMALFQAATITPDAISNGIGFLFVAGCLRLADGERMDWSGVQSLVLLVFLLFLAKLNLIPLVLLPFLLLPPSRFASRGLYLFLLAATLFLFLVEVAGWNWIASRNFSALLLDEANPGAQLRFLLGHPFAFLGTVARDVSANGWTYFQGWINGYGYYYWTPPRMVTGMYLLGLAAGLWSDSTAFPKNRNARPVLLLVFLAGYAATIASLYISYTPVGAGQVLGVQGRYFIPLLLPLLLVVGSFTGGKAFLPARWIPAILGTALSFNLLGLFFSFHVPCGSTYYQTGLCYRPLFKDLPGEVRPSEPVSEGRSLTQEILVACNGLAEIRVLVAPTNAGPGATRFRLRESAQTLLDTTIANEQIRPDAWHALRFAPLWNSAGKQYVLEISGTGSGDNQGPPFLFTPQPEFDLGQAYENGQSLEQDLVLQYGCVTGLQKIWRTGKP